MPSRTRLSPALPGPLRKNPTRRQAMTQPRVLAVIPFSSDYEDGRLFVTGSNLDRDGVLQPWKAFADSMRSSGWIVDTADRLDRRSVSAWLHLDSAAPPPPEAQPARQS